MKAGSTAMTLRSTDRVHSESMLALPDSRSPEQIHSQTFDDPFFWQLRHDLHALGSTGQTVNKKYYVEVLSEFRKRFRWKRPALFKSGQWHFHQDNAPVHNSILVTDYLTKMGIRTVPHPPYSSDLSPCDFWLFPKLKEKFRGCRYETIEGMKEAVTKVIDTLTQEDFMGPSVSCWNGTTSFMYVLSIKFAIQKSLGTYLMILVHIYTMNFRISQLAFVPAGCIWKRWHIDLPFI